LEDCASAHVTDPVPTEAPVVLLADAELRARRLAAKRLRRRRRRMGALVAAAVVLLGVVLAIALSGSSASRRGRHVASNAAEQATSIDPRGGPLAPARYGGLAALWAPQNVIGAQPATAAAYEAASRLKALPGYLMIADRGNNRILVVSPAGKLVFQYPRRGDRGHLYFDDDTFVAPGGAYVISNEEENEAIVAVGLSDRKQRVLFGHPGEAGSDATHVNSPDDAYMLPDGTFTVADADNCRILFIRAHRIVRSFGHAGVCRHEPPRYLGQVNGDTPLPSGGVLVSEIAGDWIDEIGPEGRLRWALQAPVGYPSDPQPLPGGRVLLADYSNPGHVLIIDRRGHVLWRYGPSRGFGRLDHPSLAMALPNGDVAVNDDYRDRVVIIDPRTNRIVWKYGSTEHPGTAPGHLDIPDGMDFIPAAADGSPDYAAVVHP
jgi:hypothetical protein